MKIHFFLNHQFYLFFSLFFTSWLGTYAQIFFYKFPKSNQVLQRNNQNEASIDIKGVVTEKGSTSVSLEIFQDGILFTQSKVSLTTSLNFEFSTKIKAGKYNYTVKVLLNDDREIKSATRVAVGDLFLIYGQSNALGNGGIETYFPARNPLVRYFKPINYDSGESEWFFPYETFFWPSIGALEFANFLSSKYGYPIGIIEGSVGGAYMKSLNNRNASNPADKSSIYGRMILQTDFADVRNQIKYMIFRHGESDGYFNGESQVYPIEFEKLYNYLNTDFPNLTKIYNIQSNILTESNDDAGFLRDFQRRTKFMYPKISTMSTVGTVGYEGLHYKYEGYKQSAYELSRIVGKEIYKDTFSDEIYSPDIKKAFWENNKLVLEFDQSMKMLYPNDSMVNGFLYKMSDYIYIDDKNSIITSGKALDNRIILTVDNFENSKFVSYLPPWFSENSNHHYEGVHLKNTFGMRAFSFDNVEILGQETIIPPVPTILASGAINFCEGHAVILSTTFGYEEYKWFKDGVQIHNNSTKLAVNQSGVYTVEANRLGATFASTNNIRVQVFPIPQKPQILNEAFPDKFLLTSSSPSNNQWFLNDKLIVGATNQTFVPQEIGNYSVTTTQNGCKNTSEISNVKVDKPTITLSDTKTFCEGDSAKLIATSGFGNYFFANGKEEISTNRNEFYAKKTGYYSVIAKRGTIKTPKSDSIFVKINPIPSQPTLTLENFTLKSSSLTNNEWTIDGKVVKDSVGQFLHKVGFGSYSVRVIENVCASASTQLVITGNEPSISNFSVKLYPNSNDGQFWVELPDNIPTWTIDIYDTHGRNILSKFHSLSASNKEFIHLQKISGSYILKITSEKNAHKVRFIID